MFKKMAHVQCDDPRLCYDVVPKPTAEDLEPVAEGTCGVVKNQETTPIDKYDYLIPLTEEDKATSKHTQPLPLSFLQIKEGDVDSGILWYKQHYPKVPDELIEIMARYNFGDLKYATRKSIKNNAKKYKKKSADAKALQTQGLVVKKGPVKVVFDEE
jgi:hypothetical protein